MNALTTANPPYPQVPVLDSTQAIICLVINIFVPGIGTIVGGVMGQKPLIGRGIAQLLLSIIIVGWVWGIVTGVQLLQNATWKEKGAGRTVA
jgi:hypothetical protein